MPVRIYQGKVKSAKFTDSSEKSVVEMDQGATTQFLFEINEVFQDAVNYYMVCLLAMASSEDNPLTKIRSEIDSGNENQTWKPFIRNGVKRQGLNRVAKYFGLDPERATLEDCCKKAIDISKENFGEKVENPKELMDLALRELLFLCEGDSKIQQEGRSMFPRFCNKEYSSSYGFDEASREQEQGIKYFQSDFHKLSSDDEYQEIAKKIEMSWVGKLNLNKPPMSGNESKGRLLKAVQYLKSAYTSQKEGMRTESLDKFLISNKEKYLNVFDNIEKEIESLKYIPEIYNNNKVVPARYETVLLFKYFPSDETATLVKAAFPYKENKKDVLSKKKDDPRDMFLKFGDDAVKLARGKRGFVFEAFTQNKNSLFAGGLGDWNSSFEIPAFKEALKTFNQIQQKGSERSEKLEQNSALQKYMETGEKIEKADLLELYEEYPIIFNDDRIVRLEQLLGELKKSNDVLGDDSETYDYGFGRKTISGFPTIVKKWQRENIEGLSESEIKERLKKILSKEQTENREVFGSSELFEKMINAEYRVIWQNSFDRMPEELKERGLADNPLMAYVKYSDLKQEAKQLEEPIKFTPADANHSVRQYELDNAKHQKSENGYHYVSAPCFGKIKDRYIKGEISIKYTAPRFIRDGLRSYETEADGLEAMHLKQPMFAPFDDKSPSLNLEKTAVFVKPVCHLDGSRDVYLNLPIKMEAVLPQDSRWSDVQFFSVMKKKVALKWECDSAKSVKAAPWYNDKTPFRVLSVDLGVRDAGAFSILECRPNGKFDKTSKGDCRHSRFIGNAGNVKWYAAPIHTGLIRIQGEDAMVFRNGKLQQELYGEKGRKASEYETEQTKIFVESLGFPELNDPADINWRFIYRQNDKMILAFKWAKNRLARWQAWSWQVNDEKRKDSVRDELLSIDKDLLPDSIIPELVKEFPDWNLVCTLLCDAIEKLKCELCKKFEVLANRVVPLRNQCWKWEIHNGNWRLDSTELISSSSVRIAGQRGLSMERIEQLTSFRRQCQSFAKMLLCEAGKKPKINKRGTSPDPCPDILAKIDRMRNERINQTAHSILAEALGVALKTHEIDCRVRNRHDIHGEYEKIRTKVDMIVLEDLSRYLTSQDRSRAENSQLMQWCHRAILDKVKMFAEIYSIPVIEVSAAYSSKFSSKNAMPGFRAREISLAQAKQSLEIKKAKDLEGIQELKSIIEIAEKKKLNKVIVPMAGGPLFVPMNGNVLQADINAAVNLGLRAVAEPSVLSIHHKVRTFATNGVLKPRRDNVREKALWKDDDSFNFNNQAVEFAGFGNCFNIPDSFVPKFESCELDGKHFVTSKGLWTTIKEKQWDRIRELLNGPEEFPF